MHIKPTKTIKNADNKILTSTMIYHSRLLGNINTQTNVKTKTTGSPAVLNLISFFHGIGKISKNRKFSAYVFPIVNLRLFKKRNSLAQRAFRFPPRNIRTISIQTQNRRKIPDDPPIILIFSLNRIHGFAIWTMYHCPI